MGPNLTILSTSIEPKRMNEELGIVTQIKIKLENSQMVKMRP